MGNPILFIYSEHSPIPHTVNFPLSMYAVGKYLEKRGYDILYYDERVDKKKILEAHLKRKPLLALLSTMTSYQIISTINLSKFVKNKNPNTSIVWGGVHPSLCINQTIGQEYIDFVVVGEGEKTILELADFLKNKRTDFEKIDGIAWKNNGKIVINKPREFMDFGEAEFPYEGIDNETLNKYLIKDKNIKSIKPVFYQSSRGCLYSCTFCYNDVFNKKRVRLRPIHLVREELKKLKDMGVKEISFCDDDAFSKERLFEVNKITKDLGMKWSASMRVGYIDEETAKVLEQGNCQYIFFGLESGNQETLNYMRKGINLEQIKRCVEAISKTKIIPTYSFVFGFPREPKNHMKDSFELIDWILKMDKKANITLQTFTPIPGTEMYRISIEEGFEEPKRIEDWAKMVAHEVNTPWVKDKALLKNLYVVAMFAFRYGELLNNKMFYIPHLIAKWRWEHKFFKLGYERILFDTAQRLTTGYYSIRRKVTSHF